MENKEYTLQNAKDDVAKREDWTNWDDFIAYSFDKKELDRMFSMAFELYKTKATEELRKENQALSSYAEDMNDRVRKAIQHSLDKDKEMDDLIEIHHLQTKDLVEEIERLTQSNKELIEALKYCEYDAESSMGSMNQIIQRIKTVTQPHERHN